MRLRWDLQLQNGDVKMCDSDGENSLRGIPQQLRGKSCRRCNYCKREPIGHPVVIDDKVVSYPRGGGYTPFPSN